MYALIDRERKKFVRYVRSLVNDAADMDAEDIVHDVLLRVLERADLTLSSEGLTAYIYRSLKNRVIDNYRTRRSTVSMDEQHDEQTERLIDMLEDHRPNAIEYLQSLEGKKELFSALETLSDMERQVIIAHEFEGHTFRELAKGWGIPQNTLLSHKSRALTKLRKHYLDAKGE